VARFSEPPPHLVSSPAQQLRPLGDVRRDWRAVWSLIAGRFISTADNSRNRDQWALCRARSFRPVRCIQAGSRSTCSTLRRLDLCRARSFHLALSNLAGTHSTSENRVRNRSHSRSPEGARRNQAVVAGNNTERGQARPQQTRLHQQSQATRRVSLVFA